MPLDPQAEMLLKQMASAEVLRGVGVPATVTRYPGMIHGFFTMANVLDQGKRAVAEAAQALKKAFGN